MSTYKGFLWPFRGVVPGLATAACVTLLSAQTTPITIQVASQTVPPGGGGQIQIQLTSPRPIMTGKLAMDFGSGFDSIDGVALFSPTGDVSGAAVVKNGTVSARFTSPQGTFGTTLDYPIMTVAYTVSPLALPGITKTIRLDAASGLTDLFGDVPLEMKPGTLTVGGTLSVKNVVPGGGRLPAGTVISLLGTGFNSKTKVVIKECKTDVRFKDANEMLLTLRQDLLLDGQAIVVTNPDNSKVMYYSYLRGVPVGASSDPLLAVTVPVFSTNTFTRAQTPGFTVSPLNPDYLDGLALQNPNLAAVDITIEHFDGNGQSLAKVNLSLAPGKRLVRGIAELTGVTPQLNHYVAVSANRPVQALSLLAQTSTGTVLPVNVVPVP